MKEIKVYLRKKRVDTVVHALRDAGVGHMTISHVHTVGDLADSENVRISFESGTTYTEHAKLELVCAEPEVEGLVRTIERSARTGEPGDGIIFVAPVDRAVKIRTGVEGREALR